MKRMIPYDYNEKVIDSLSNEQKSYLLAKAMDWPISKGDRGSSNAYSPTAAHSNFVPDDCIIWRRGDGFTFYIESLYDKSVFFVAWQVLEWFCETFYDDDGEMHDEFDSWWYYAELWKLPLEEAQGKWLDKILHLCVNDNFIHLPLEA
jgi:hypothetical protein